MEVKLKIMKDIQYIGLKYFGRFEVGIFKVNCQNLMIIFLFQDVNSIFIFVLQLFLLIILVGCKYEKYMVFYLFFVKKYFLGFKEVVLLRYCNIFLENISLDFNLYFGQFIIV